MRLGLRWRTMFLTTQTGSPACEPRNGIFQKENKGVLLRTKEKKL